jgi:hypothetical protein
MLLQGAGPGRNFGHRSFKLVYYGRDISARGIYALLLIGPSGRIWERE